MAAVNVYCIMYNVLCMSGDQRSPQMYVGDQRWPHVSSSMVVANINYVLSTLA